jgi:hypothetical protein
VIEVIGVSRKEFLNEKKDAMSRSEQKIKTEGIVESPLGCYACNSFGQHRKSQVEEFFS